MPETELDRRLRAALARPVEPASSSVRLASLRAALPARLARRRLAVGAVAAVAVLGVALGVVVPGTGGPPPSGVAIGHSTAAGPACVEVSVGSAPPSCAGQVISPPAIAAPRARGGDIPSGSAGPLSTACGTPRGRLTAPLDRGDLDDGRRDRRWRCGRAG